MNSVRPMRARSTISWGVLDQVVSSGSTFIFIVIAARALSATDLGAAALAFEIYLLSVFTSRGVTGDSLTSKYSGLADAELRPHIRAAITTALMIGGMLGLALAGGAWLFDPPLRDVLLVLAVALPALTLQDFIRSALIVQGRVRATFCNDSLWTFGQIPAMGLAIAIEPSAPVVVGAWAATGTLAAVVGLLQLRCTPSRPGTVRGWLRRTRDVWPYYLGDNLLYIVSSFLLMLIVSVSAGLAAAAGFRVAMTVYAPLSLVGRGVISVAVAMLARRRHDPLSVRKQATLISSLLTPLAFGWGLLTLLVPMSVGEAFFGDSWREAEPVVFLASFVCASGLFTTGMVIGLRSLSAGRHTFVGRIVVSVGASIAAVIGGALGAEYGLFLALAFFFPVQVVVWWGLLRDATRRAQAALAATARGEQAD